MKPSESRVEAVSDGGRLGRALGTGTSGWPERVANGLIDHHRGHGQHVDGSHDTVHDEGSQQLRVFVEHGRWGGGPRAFGARPDVWVDRAGLRDPVGQVGAVWRRGSGLGGQEGAVACRGKSSRGPDGVYGRRRLNETRLDE